MKISSLHFALICAVCISLFACKKTFNLQKEPTSISYNPYGLTYLHDLVITKSGDLLLLGESNAQILLTKTTKTGKMLWQKKVDFMPEHDMEYTIHNVVENEDGSILLFGTQSKVLGNNNFAVFKLSSTGENLKTKTFFIATNDTAHAGMRYSTYHRGIYTKDGEGGYFIQLRLGIGYSNGAGRADYIVHYNASDSFDLLLDPNLAHPSYEGKTFEFAANMDVGNTVLLNMDFYNTGNYSVDMIDKEALLKGKMVQIWSTDFPSVNGWVAGYFDEQHFYNCNIPLNDDQTEIKGIQISKLDMQSGSIVKQWMLPFKNEILNSGSLFQNWAMVSDESFLYIPVNYDNSSYIIKAAKDGSDYKAIPIGGNISRDLILKIAPIGDQILVFSYSSLNRSQEQGLCMFRINKNGDISDHEE